MTRSPFSHSSLTLYIVTTRQQLRGIEMDYIQKPMKTPEDVAVMLGLHDLGWGSGKIADELAVSRNTVKRYLRQQCCQPYRKPDRVQQTRRWVEWS